MCVIEKEGIKCTKNRQHDTIHSYMGYFKGIFIRLTLYIDPHPDTKRKVYIVILCGSYSSMVLPEHL